MSQTLRTRSDPLSAREVLWVGTGALLVFAVEMIGIATPSLWYDEAATFSGASRSLPSLWAMIAEVDAVHALFYLTERPLVWLAGADPVALRAPAAGAVALTAAAIYLLGRRLGPRSLALAAALLFIGLGRTSWMATEARSFALTTLIATVLTLVLTIFLTSARRRWLFVYAGTALVGIVLFALFALLLLAHAITALIVRRSVRGALPLWCAMLLPAFLSIPFVLLVYSQRGQLGGVFEIDGGTWSRVFVSEFFHREGAQALVVWSLLTAALLTLGVRSLIGRAERAERAARHEPLPPGILSVTLPWLIVPTVAILVFSTVSSTIYQPRALVWCAPALCLLVAAALRHAFAGWVAVVAAIAVVALGIPAFVANRELTAKGSDWPAAAAYLADNAVSGDVVVYSDPIDYHTWPSLMRIVHPESLRPLHDIALRVEYDQRAALFDERAPLSEWRSELSSASTVWYVSAVRLSAPQRADTISALEQAGLVECTTWNGPRTRIQEWVPVGDSVRCANALS